MIEDTSFSRTLVTTMVSFLTLLVCLLWISLDFSSALTNITNTHFLRDPEAIISSNTMFMLGFFSPTNSSHRYAGIWYNIGSEPLEVVWVANRDNPLNDSSGVLKLSKDGNLQVLNGQNKILWTSNVSSNKEGDVVGQLLDTGNLVLVSNANGEFVWQSYDHPTAAFLPGMKFNIDKKKNQKQVFFHSWRGPSDPATGVITVGIETENPPAIYVWDGDRPYWRTLPWNGNLITALTLVTDYQGTTYLSYTFSNQSLSQHFLMDYDGMIIQKDWDDGSRKWSILWKSMQSECDVYGKCGAFASCNPNRSSICSCLKGFVPKNETEWREGIWTNGCVRKKIECQIDGDKADGFVKLSNVKVPDNAEWISTQNQTDCGWQCLKRCSCIAYSYHASVGCMIWNGSLMDIQEYSDDLGLDLFIRLDQSELGDSKTSKWKIIVVLLATMGTITLVVFMYFLWRWIKRRNRTRVRMGETLSSDKFARHIYEVELRDLPLFTLQKLAIATNNFHEANKLGEGGFGPVHKGKLEDGQEIAVKRLSKASGQGIIEFMNEVLVISKLQHRNLVRLLGCCVEGGENILVYEYMPNGSLDALIFDQLQRKLLHWKQRYDIIQGICRGLLYLHRDSRLRIIHRDLKTSNILLDSNLNPKISDFGMAKIFGGNQNQAETKRVVGTYGYMSPEYAMEGRFSEKADVFSFGVVLLEIISGIKNTTFQDDDSFSLLEYAWKLWIGEDIQSLTDPTISNSHFQQEIMRCIQIGLLCVQEIPEDRPTISDIISMLDREVSDLPRPSRPGFTRRRSPTHSGLPQNGQQHCSVDFASLTTVSGR